MEKRKLLSVILSIVFLGASAVVTYIAFSGGQNLQTVFTRASTSGPLCPAGTEPLFNKTGTLTKDMLVGAGGKISSLTASSTNPWAVGTQDGTLVAEHGNTMSISFTKVVTFDSVIIYDNDHDPGWTINNVNLTRTANEVWAPIMPLNLKDDFLNFDNHGDSAHFNVCIKTEVPTNTPTPTKSPTKTPTPQTGTLSCNGLSVVTETNGDKGFEILALDSATGKSPAGYMAKVLDANNNVVSAPIQISDAVPQLAIPSNTLSAGIYHGYVAPIGSTNYVTSSKCTLNYQVTTPTPTKTVTPTKSPTPTTPSNLTPTEPPLCKLDAEIMVVIDRSGSMNSKDSTGKTKIDYAKEAAINMVEYISKSPGVSAKIGVVSFGSQGNDGTSTRDPANNSTLHLPPSSDYTKVKEALNTIVYVRDGTCIECGLRIANGQFSSSIKNKVVILLSDGRANHTWDGSTTTTSATAITEAKKGQALGIDYYVLGYGTGSGIDEVSLKAIAGDPTHYQYKPAATDWVDAYLNVLEKVCQEITPTPGTCQPPVKVKNIKINCPNCANP